MWVRARRGLSAIQKPDATNELYLDYTRASTEDPLWPGPHADGHLGPGAPLCLACQRAAVVTMLSRALSLADHPSTSWARRASATTSAGSPARRGANSWGTSRPNALPTVVSTS